MNIHRFACFGREKGIGNVAVVVEASALDESQRLRFAKQQNANATVFIDASGTDTVLDYYYPHTRSPLCLHATLAASAHFFEKHPKSQRAQFVSSLHRQQLEIERSHEGIFIELKPQPCPKLQADVADIAKLLHVDPRAIIGLPRVASVGAPKLLVEMDGKTALDGLRPNLAAIVEWSGKCGVSGIYTYSHRDNDAVIGRNFNHLEPHLEDAATGVAAGALAVALKRSFTLLQGDTVGRPCAIIARYRGETVQIGGNAGRMTD